MLGHIVVAIMMGFPTAFTLMGLGMIFGYIAFWDPVQHWWQNRAFDLIVQRTYGVMTNDNALVDPLFVFMGYIMSGRRWSTHVPTACSWRFGASRRRWRDHAPRMRVLLGYRLRYRRAVVVLWRDRDAGRC